MPAPRRPMHKWTAKDRELLCVLKIKYSRRFIAPIFNHLLSSRLAMEGFQNGVTAPSLDTQWQEMKAGGGGHDIYARISSLSQDDIATEYRAHSKEIDMAVHSLKLNVKPNSRIRKCSTKIFRNNLRKTGLLHANYSQAIDVSDESSDLSYRQTVARTRVRQFADHLSPYFSTETPANQSVDETAPLQQVNDNITVPPALRIGIDFNGNTASARPLLLFRATPTVENFRSRKYADPIVHVPLPPQAASKEYRDISRPHLERDKSYKSPFISLAQNPRNAIRRIETATSEHVDQKMFLTVFSFNDIEADSTRAFGPASGPQLVRSLYSAKEISDLPDGYKGSGEWLVYGRIDCEPICILDAAQAVILAKALRKYKGGDLGALSAVSDNMRAVPYKWREAVAYVLFRYYCGQSHVPKVASQAYCQLMNTVVNGKQGLNMELLDFSRLSVIDNGSEYEDESTEDSTTPHRRLVLQQNASHAAQSVPITATTKPVSPSTERVDSVIKNLNYLASQSALQELPQNAHQATPFWSPDPSESIGAVAATVLPPLNQARASPLQELVNLEGADDDDDWDFVNDDLEQSFVESFPSAFKRVKHLQSVNHVQATSEIDFDEEDEDYIVPSIEKDRPCNDENSYSRENFLWGVAKHAASITPPIQETPSKTCRQPTSAQILNARNSGTTSTIEGQGPATGTSKFSPYQAYVNRRPTRIQAPFSERSGFPRLISRDGRGSTDTKKNANTSTLDLNGWPKTSIRTKVPVIVRKKIVDC